jgi:flagellar hook-basal body complex protein FliE
METNAIQAVRALDIASAGVSGAAQNGAAFSEILRAAYTSVESSGTDASRMVEGFLSGDRQDLHSVALAAQRASLEFEMLLQVRNKIVQAYQEVMRMQL